MQPQLSTFKSKRDIVYEHLRAEILHGAFAPGERIIIDGLAAQLGVSQIPIREALQQLQAEGFVVMEPHIGPRVAEIHASLIGEVFQLLEALEVISGRAACQRMTDAQFAEMEQILRRMDTLGDNLEQWAMENELLHASLCEWAKTNLVANLMRKVLDQWDRLRHHYLKDVLVRRFDQSQREHWELFAALRARDADRVEQILRDHNQRALKDYVKHLKATGQIIDAQLL
jgi:DNA-binding GntR family transcriptional regulator